jgi:hypothetical protein
MMTVEELLFTLLSPLVANTQVFPDLAPDGTPPPYITYQQVGGQSVGFLENTIPSKKNGRFQINVWGDDRLTAAALGLLVETTLITATDFQATALGDRTAEYERDTKLYGTRQDFSIWSDR